MAGHKNHDYHILPPSIWPFTGAVGAHHHAGRRGAVVPRQRAVDRADRPRDRALHHVVLVGRRDRRGRGGRPYRRSCRSACATGWCCSSSPRSCSSRPGSGPSSSTRSTRWATIEGVDGHPRHLAAGRHRDLRPLAPAADQHADPALLRLRRDLGAPRAGARERPRAGEVGPVAGDRARAALHHLPGLRVLRRGLRLLRQHLRRVLLHGDRLPRLPRHHRHDLPRGLPARASMPATSPRPSTSASRRRPGTGTSSTWSGCSSSPSIYIWGSRPERAPPYAYVH